MLLNLVVIRSKNISSLAEFYADLGLEFEYHKHGNGSFHFSTKIGETVFEIYPIKSNKENVTKDVLRLGFSIKNLDQKIEELRAKNYRIISEPQNSEYGYFAIVEDFDKPKIELTEES